MTETKEQQECPFCQKFVSIVSNEADELWRLDPNSGYGKAMLGDNVGNVQVDINMRKYPDATSGANAVFRFNYCPMCGRKL